MEITWYGHSCFRMTERGMATVVADPFDSKTIGYSPLRLKADIVTISHDAPGHNNSDAVKGASHVIRGRANSKSVVFSLPECRRMAPPPGRKLPSRYETHSTSSTMTASRWPTWEI